MSLVALILLLAWQTLGRATSFALGWATGLVFGQVPGNRSTVLSIVALLSLGWLALIVAIGTTLAIGAVAPAQEFAAAGASFGGWQIAAVVGAICVPPALALVAAVGDLHAEPRRSRQLATPAGLASSYLAVAALGAGVLQLLVLAPLLILRRPRGARSVVHLPVSIERGAFPRRAAGYGYRAAERVGSPRASPADRPALAVALHRLRGASSARDVDAG